ncbi:integral membrane protein 2C [Ischnura elegans]|uniref:integral membrane protein 2C n=1 Tax=Ischnura elegans TaxID=197161 RepID=UPI001ED87F5A|nr:integral membrane protein 2C [Ischnura elegans]
MTIVTKPITEKKTDKLEEPLVDNEINESLPSKVDIEATAEPEPHYLLMRGRARRVSTATTVFLFLTALIVMCIGIVGGVFVYRQFARAQMHRIRGWCKIPLPPGQPEAYKMGEEYTDDLMTNRFKGANTHAISPGYFNEQFDLDPVLNYEKIDVPDFSNGRRGRFIHDFNSNKTGIIDLDGHRCFVMPLNRRQVLPPRSLYDLVQKMWEGYYDVDTEVVRDTMKVVTPPIIDKQSVGTYIRRECNGLPIYKLEKYNAHPVFKRSIGDEVPSTARFVEYAGKNFVEFNIMNMDEVVAYESAQEKKSGMEVNDEEAVALPLAAVDEKRTAEKGSPASE